LADENFGGKELALALGMSWSTLNRKLQALTGKHISQLIREIRLQRALELLQENNATAAEVAYKVGFGGPAYFNKCFNDFYGFPPGEVKKRLEDGTLPLADENQPTDISFPETTSLSILGRLPKPYRIAAFAGLALLIIALGMVFLAKKGDFSYHLQGKEKSIAVLPFKNLSPEADNQYFADGITEDILNHLFRISDLRVISRTTAERFRDSDLPITEIAKSMGVNYLLEGSVRKQGDNVRITVQLIDGKSDRHLWSENYDRQLADIFFIQSDIAQNVARELRTVLSPGETQKLKAAQTRNLEAYDFYLRGSDYLNRSYREEDYRFAMQMYQKAVEIDPDFALAWVGLAASSRYLYWWFYYALSDEILQKTKQYLDKALALAPALKEVQLEEAIYYYQCERDYLKSVEFFKKLQTEYPNNDDIIFWLAMVYRRMGELEKSLEYTNLAISLNPSNWVYWNSASVTLQALKDYKKAKDYAQTAIDLNPSYSALHDRLFEIYMRSGQIDKAKGFLITNKKYFAAHDYIGFQAHLEFRDRNFIKAIQFAQSLTEERTFSQFDHYSKQLALGQTYATVSDSEMAKKHFELARNFFLEKIRESGNNHRLYGSLGIAYAGLGMKEQALDAGNKALEILNSSKDAFDGFYPEMDMVMILVLLEEYNEALFRLDRIIKHTGLITTVEELKLHPIWDPVREHPKFKEIINNPEYQIRL
jgi:TolB-like protein/AraC-like DNA-binding protein/Flp pilus assembly protein TadD